MIGKKKNAKQRRKERDASRSKRQLKIDFDSVESLEDFKAIADEWGVSYTQLANLFIAHGKHDFIDGQLNLHEYLTKSKQDWLRDHDIDVKKYEEDRKKRRKK